MPKEQMLYDGLTILNRGCIKPPSEDSFGLYWIQANSPSDRNPFECITNNATIAGDLDSFKNNSNSADNQPNDSAKENFIETLERIATEVFDRINGEGQGKKLTYKDFCTIAILNIQMRGFKANSKLKILNEKQQNLLKSFFNDNKETNLFSANFNQMDIKAKLNLADSVEKSFQVLAEEFKFYGTSIVIKDQKPPEGKMKLCNSGDLFCKVIFANYLQNQDQEQAQEQDQEQAQEQAQDQEQDSQDYESHRKLVVSAYDSVLNRVNNSRNDCNSSMQFSK